MSSGVNHQKAPFPGLWPGGKSKAAPLVWDLLGDPAHYVEPFAGSMAVLLNRPHPANRSYYSETVNDADGLLVNAWRGIQLAPDATVEAASWPVAEADLHARHVALIRWREERQLEHLMGDPGWCDPVMAGWWLWGVCSWIGSGWCQTDVGPWWPDENDRLTKWAKDDPDRPTINGTRDPGVWRQRPHLANNGMGVNRPQLRDPGVWRHLPHLADNWMGVNHAGTRDPGVTSDADTDDEVGEEFHSVTMPELRRWMHWLSARLRHVRIVNGDWTRVTGTGAVQSLPVRQGNGHAGIFLDPPYSAAADRASLYGDSEDFEIAHRVRDWCLEWGDRTDYRIVLAGFEGEGHETLEDQGWTVHEWFTSGHLTGGYGNQNRERGHQQHRERLWASPACQPDEGAQLGLFDSALIR